jgi:hypothetical protein
LFREGIFSAISSKPAAERLAVRQEQSWSLIAELATWLAE